MGAARPDPHRPLAGDVRRPAGSVRDDLASGARFVLGHPLFRTLLAWSALTNLVVNALFFVAVLRLIEDGVDPVHLGLVETAAGAAGILGAVVAPWIIDRFATGRLTIAIAWSFLPLLVPMALWNSPVVVAAALALVLLLNPAGNAGIGAYRLAVTPPELVGRVQSFSQFAGMAAMPLAPVLAGGSLALLGGSAAILALGVVVAGTALIPTLSVAVRRCPGPRCGAASSSPCGRQAGMDPHTSGRAARRLETLHALGYFAPEVEAELVALGIRKGRATYFASRSAALGGSARASSPRRTTCSTRPWWPSSCRRCGTRPSPRPSSSPLRGISAAWTRLLGDEVLASAEVAEAADLVRAAAAGCTVAGRPLYAAHADLAWPDEPHLALWHGLTLLREHRGDGHVAVLQAPG